MRNELCKTLHMSLYWIWEKVGQDRAGRHHNDMRSYVNTSFQRPFGDCSCSYGRWLSRAMSVSLMVIVEVNNSHLCNCEHDHLRRDNDYYPYNLCPHRHMCDCGNTCQSLSLHHTIIITLSSLNYFAIFISFFGRGHRCLQNCWGKAEKQKSESNWIADYTFSFVSNSPLLSLVLGIMKIRLVTFFCWALTRQEAEADVSITRYLTDSLNFWFDFVSRVIESPEETSLHMDRENKAKVPFGAVVGSA